MLHNPLYVQSYTFYAAQHNLIGEDPRQQLFLAVPIDDLEILSELVATLSRLGKSHESSELFVQPGDVKLHLRPKLLVALNVEGPHYLLMLPIGLENGVGDVLVCTLQELLLTGSRKGAPALVAHPLLQILKDRQDPIGKIARLLHALCPYQAAVHQRIANRIKL